MVGEPVHEDDVEDTVLRARPRSGTVAGDRGHDPDDDGDPLGDTVIRPRSTARPSAGPAPHDTVVRDRSGDRRTDGPTTGGGDRVVRPPMADPVGSVGPHPHGRAGTGLPTAPPPRRTPSVRVGDRTVRLDRPVVVGRRPAAPRIVLGAAPELLTVPSPSGQVSSSHLLVHAEGEVAVVQDLVSTNGTVVRPPGAAPFRMAAGASIVVLTGTVVEIGDGNVIEVLSPHLRVGPDDGLPPFPPAP